MLLIVHFKPAEQTCAARSGRHEATTQLRKAAARTHHFHKVTKEGKHAYLQNPGDVRNSTSAALDFLQVFSFPPLLFLLFSPRSCLAAPAPSAAPPVWTRIAEPVTADQIRGGGVGNESSV